MAGGKECGSARDGGRKGRTGIRRVAVLLLGVVLLTSALAPGVLAEETDEAEEPTTEQVTGATEAKDDVVETKHEVTIGGKTISYTATAGTMVVDLDGEKAEMFFVAYTKDDVTDVSERPVTFAFNGGPGSSSGYINIGCFGPRKVELDETGTPTSMPARISDNPNSILDLTDLVFIDPVGMGYSRPVGDGTLESFIGYENDLRSMGEFIRLYVNRYDRWGSEKYLAGESYGTTRAVGLCDYLHTTYALDVNGLILISAHNDSATVVEDSTDLPYVTVLPTLAADAWYHKKVSKIYQDMGLEEFLDEVRTFAVKDYQYGLFMGDRLPDKEADELAERLSGFIGLSKDFILEHDLRVGVSDFRMELLKDEGLTLGRFDGRMSGSSYTEKGLESDPSGSAIDNAFGNTFVDYVTRELKYKTDVPYVPISMEIYEGWGYPGNTDRISQEGVIYACMANNRFLRIWVLSGYYDGATPFFASEWAFSHVFLDDEAKNNLQFTYYPSGHMIYVEKSSHDKLRQDAEEWFAKGRTTSSQDQSEDQDQPEGQDQGKDKGQAKDQSEGQDEGRDQDDGKDQDKEKGQDQSEGQGEGQSEDKDQDKGQDKGQGQDKDQGQDTGSDSADASSR